MINWKWISIQLVKD